MTEIHNYKILIADEDEKQYASLSSFLSAAGFENVQTVDSPGQVARAILEVAPDLILLALDLMDAQAWAILEGVQPLLVAREPAPPLLLITKATPAGLKEKAVPFGVTDFVRSPLEAVEVTQRVRCLLESRGLSVALAGEDRSTTQPAKNDGTLLDLISSLAQAAEYREDSTGQHPQRVGRLSALLGHELGFPGEQVHILRHAAKLHDIGKVGVPDGILFKPDKLTSEEFEILKQHTVIGARLLAGLQNPILRTAREIALGHHENWDGTGYPNGLEGEQIPPSTRLVSIVDVFDALTHSRPYRKAFSVEMTLEFIRAERGRQFDPEAVDAFLRIIDRDDVQAVLDESTPETSIIIERFLDDNARASTEEKVVS